MKEIDAKLEQARKDRDAIERHIQELEAQKLNANKPLPLFSVAQIRRGDPDNMRLIINVKKLREYLCNEPCFKNSVLFCFNGRGIVNHHSEYETEKGLCDLYTAVEPLSDFFRRS
jgi:hypothetical protein